MASPLTQAKQATVEEDLKHKCRIVTNLTFASKLDLVKHRKVKQENKTWRPRLSHAKCCPHHLDDVKAANCCRSCHLPSNQDVDTERCQISNIAVVSLVSNTSLPDAIAEMTVTRFGLCSLEECCSAHTHRVSNK